MEQIPRVNQEGNVPNPAERILALRAEIVELARKSVSGLFEKRGLQPLNVFNGSIDFVHRISGGALATSDFIRDHIEVHEESDISLPVYIHEMLHGHTNIYTSLSSRLSKTGINSNWEKKFGVATYFLALNEGLTELLTDEAFESSPMDTYNQLRQKLLEAKKELLPLELEAFTVKSEREIEGYIQSFVKLPIKIEASEEDYQKWVQSQIESQRILKELEPNMDTQFPTSREAFQSQAEHYINAPIHNLIGLINSTRKLVELITNRTKYQLEDIDRELKEGFVHKKLYTLERELIDVLVKKIADITNEDAEIILEKMKTAYLQGNTLYFRVIGKVLGDEILGEIALLGGQEFTPSELDIENANKVYSDIEDERIRSSLVKELALGLVKKRYYDYLIQNIKSAPSPLLNHQTLPD